MDPGSDPYVVLGVSALASDEEIHRAYRALARGLHPDTKPDDAAAAARFAQVSEAYEMLHDPVRRRAFDLSRAARQGPRPSRSAPGPTGNTAVRGPEARPAHAPRPVSPAVPSPVDAGEPPAAERDELAFLFGFFKVLAVLAVVFLVAVLIASLNPAPYCAPGVDPPCRPHPSSSGAGSIEP